MRVVTWSQPFNPLKHVQVVEESVLLLKHMSLSENHTNPLFIYSIHWLIMLIVYHVLPP